MITRICDHLAHGFRELLEAFRRSWCEVIGHNWRQDGGPSHPTIPLIAVCRRCGKFVRLIDTPPTPEP